ncbi:hypothetical protein ACHAXS_000289, partial [Conticribra weissflogii]
MALSLQAEWQYICRVVPGIAQDLAPVKAVIRSDFLLALFSSTTLMVIDNDFCCLLGHSVKMGGVSIRDPTQAADRLFEASKKATSLLAKNVVANADFTVKMHRAQVRQVLARLHKDRMEAEESFLTELSSRDHGLHNHLEAAKESGAWLTALPCHLNGMHLSPQEFQDMTHLKYGKQPLGLENTCNRCCQMFSVEHTMSCKKSGLVNTVTRQSNRSGYQWRNLLTAGPVSATNLKIFLVATPDSLLAEPPPTFPLQIPTITLAMKLAATHLSTASGSPEQHSSS